MHAIFKQDTRLGRLHTKLGKDKLVLLRFDGTDYINNLFEKSLVYMTKMPRIWL